MYLFQVLAVHQKTLLKQVVATQAQDSAHLWDQVTRSLESRTRETPKQGMAPSSGMRPVQPAVRVWNMTTSDDPEVFLKTLERTAMVAGWPED